MASPGVSNTPPITESKGSTVEQKPNLPNPTHLIAQQCSSMMHWFMHDIMHTLLIILQTSSEAAQYQKHGCACLMLLNEGWSSHTTGIWFQRVVLDEGSDMQDAKNVSTCRGLSLKVVDASSKTTSSLVIEINPCLHADYFQQFRLYYHRAKSPALNYSL